MKSSVIKPSDFELELLESQGGNISLDQFSDLISQLKSTHSLDHVGRPVYGTRLGELDIIYVVLRKGYRYECDENGFPRYTCVLKDDIGYWLAGFGSLRLSKTGYDDSAAELIVSLLPIAQRLGCGRYLVQKLLQYAFDTLRTRVRRVTAPVVCPVKPYHTASIKKQTVLNTKQLCWMFEKLGFMFEGVSRGAVKSPATVEGEEPVWHDVHRMSILDTDYLGEGRSYFLSNTRSTREDVFRSSAKTSPWDSMIQRQEEEQRDLESWSETPRSRDRTLTDDAIYEDEEDQESDNDTVMGGDDDSDWEIPEDFDD